MDIGELKAKLKAAYNPLLAARIAGIRLPRPGERLVWVDRDNESHTKFKIAIFGGLSDLPERYRDVIIARFGGEGATLQEIANRIGRTRERIRQMEVQALRRLRHHLDIRGLMTTLREAIQVEPIPGGPLDPDWVSVEEAHLLTGLSKHHLRYLCRKGYIKCQRNPLRRNYLQISRKSLRAYVIGPRRRGVWNEPPSRSL